MDAGSGKLVDVGRRRERALRKIHGADGSLSSDIIRYIVRAIRLSDARFPINFYLSI
jgi:hypothetical protein